MAKKRADQLAVDQGLSDSREKAQRLIRAGKVRIGQHAINKPGKLLDEESILSLDSPPPFVTRGGEKLKGAVDEWGFDLSGKVCADIGASHGGFTDCMLQHNAAMVYALDVGNGQLDWKLRNDERVVVMDKFNARYLDKDSFEQKPSFASVDVSFISLTKILPALVCAMAPSSELVTLIKPQFEAGKDKVGKGGVVRDPEIHEEVKETIVTFGTEIVNLTCEGIITSPIKGPAGNIEFLAYWRTKL